MFLTRNNEAVDSVVAANAATKSLGATELRTVFDEPYFGGVRVTDENLLKVL